MKLESIVLTTLSFLRCLIDSELSIKTDKVGFSLIRSFLGILGLINNRNNRKKTNDRILNNKKEWLVLEMTLK